MAIRLLIVDDETMVRMGLVAYFEDEGFEVRWADSAAEAMAILAAEEFNAAIVDLRLRDSDGESFILLAHHLRPRTQFLIHTGCLSYRLSPALRAIGLTDASIVLKPARLQQIAERIRGHGSADSLPTGEGQ